MIESLRTNPFRSPTWRWLRAQGIVEGSQPNATRRLDLPAGYKWIREAVRFKIALDDCLDQAARVQLTQRFPVLFWAHHLWSQINNPMRHSVEAYILARQNNFDIGFRAGLPPEVIEAYEQVFFNVREKLEHPEYILHCVIGPGFQHGNLSDKDFGLLWKLYGYFCGPHFLAGLISKFSNPAWCHTPDGMSEAVQDDAISTLKLKAALAAKMVNVNSGTQGMLIEQFTKFVEVERTTDSAGRAQDQILMHINALFSALPFNKPAKDDPKALDSSPLAPYDQGSVELTYEETMRASVRIPLDDDETLQRLRFPETIRTQRDLETERLTRG